MSLDFPTPAGPRIVNRWHARSSRARSKPCRRRACSRLRPTIGESSFRVTASAPSVYVEQPPRIQRLCLTLRGHRAGELGRDCIRQKAVRDIADQDHSGLGGLFQSRGDVDGVAGDERVARAGDDLAGIDPDPGLKPEGGDGGLQFERRAGRAQGVVLVDLRDSEDRHDGVADELLDARAMPLERGARIVEVAGLELPERLGIQPRAGLGVARDVAEEDRDRLAALASRGGVERRSTGVAKPGTLSVLCSALRAGHLDRVYDARAPMRPGRTRRRGASSRASFTLGLRGSTIASAPKERRVRVGSGTP